ncbi:flavin-containing monooxygenase [Aeromicrobium sp. CF4.19]|uniref:flavin-containing monooxygenase n=1 Tax=Aeromicrobium sp. CF4.19 TaxID=3373082 RepID=UPI003EE4BE12
MNPDSPTHSKPAAGDGPHRLHGSHTDVLVIGAGISGIGAAHRLQVDFPELGFVVLEAQGNQGGTWWTHRYPGVRSDSDLFTYGYRHKPWRGPAIADGEEILDYLDEVIAEDDLTPHIHYHRRVTELRWSSSDERWTAQVSCVDTGEQLQVTADFLWMCQGFYDHETPHTPDWPELKRFGGPVVHPQTWPSDLDVTGKRVLVVGSGATAATLVPALARDAEHVTMLQRSPSYWFPLPTKHELDVLLEPLGLPAEWRHEIMRRAYVQQLETFATTSRDDPDSMREFLMDAIRPLLPEGIDVSTHFMPKYRPWQQRIAMAPDGDFFAEMRKGTASVVTDTIEEFVEDGVRLSSGDLLPADVVVTATGFNLAVFGNIPFIVDGAQVDFTTRITWRGLMISGIPNMAYAFGYFRHSWTLRLDLILDVTTRIFHHMREQGASVVTPTVRSQDADMRLLPWMPAENFNAGYVQRSQHKMFRQGDREPWTHMHEHDHERTALPQADVSDGLVYR